MPVIKNPAKPIVVESEETPKSPAEKLNEEQTSWARTGFGKNYNGFAVLPPVSDGSGSYRHDAITTDPKDQPRVVGIPADHLITRMMDEPDANSAKIAELGKKYTMDNTDLETVKGLAELFMERGDYESAYEFYNYAFELNGRKNEDLAERAKEAQEKAKQSIWQPAKPEDTSVEIPIVPSSDSGNE